MVASFYIDADEECPDGDVIAFSRWSHLGLCLSGDVGSVTGDRKHKIEDDYLDELFELLRELQFNAVTYMPSEAPLGNWTESGHCAGSMAFSDKREDINSRGSPLCTAMRDEKYNLYDSTWALSVMSWQQRRI